MTPQSHSRLVVSAGIASVAVSALRRAILARLPQTDVIIHKDVARIPDRLADTWPRSMS
ncbi:MAG: hypothetical protein V4516_00595 [Pseudomonadota bacterium]